MEYIGKMPDFSVPTQNLLKEWIVEVLGQPLPASQEDADNTQIGESPPEEPNGLDAPPNGFSAGPVVDQELLFEERLSRLMTENDKLKKDNETLRDNAEDLEERLERSRDNSVGDSVLIRRISANPG